MNVSKTPTTVPTSSTPSVAPSQSARTSDAASPKSTTSSYGVGDGFSTANVEALRQASAAVVDAFNSGALPETRLAPDARCTLPSFGVAMSPRGESELATLRNAFPNLEAKPVATFVNANGGFAIAQVKLSGTFTRPLGPIAATKESVALDAFVVTRLDERGKIRAVEVYADPALTLNALGKLPDPRSSLGRLRIVASSSLWNAARIVFNTVGTKVAGLFKSKAIPDLSFVPPAAGASHFDVVKRHFDAENARDAQAATQTMSAGAISHRTVGVGNDGTTREAVYEEYRELSAAFAPLELTMRDVAQDGNRVLVLYGLDGQHVGTLGGVPATGRQVRYVAPIIFEIDSQGGIKNETSHVSAFDFLAGMGLAPDPRTPEGLAKLTR